jgi:hypothetical protein
MMIPKRETSLAIDKRSTVKAKYARFFLPILRGMILIVASWAFIEFLSEYLYGAGWLIGLPVFILATFALIVMAPRPETPPAIEDGATEKVRQLRLPDWSLLAYCFIIGLGFDWVCVFLWFSRRYAFFSAPVVGVTGLILALYVAIGLLLSRLTNWRIALIFAIATCALGAIVFRLGLLR